MVDEGKGKINKDEKRERKWDPFKFVSELRLRLKAKGGRRRRPLFRKTQFLND